MDAEQAALGKYFGAYRQARHVTLAALAPGKESAVSRFCAGKNGLALAQFHHVMARIGLRYRDLDDDFERFGSPFTHAAQSMIANRYAPTSAGVATLVNQYHLATVHAQGPIAKLNQALFDHIQQVVAKQQMVLLPEQCQVQIEQILSANSDWLIYDYLLLRLSLGYLDTERIVGCYQLLHKQLPTLQAGYQRYANDVVTQVGVILLVRQVPTALPHYVTDLQALRVNGYAFEDSLMLNFLQRLYGDLRIEHFDDVALADFRQTIDVLELREIEAYCRTIMALAAGATKGVVL
ncbi:hypothetical protein [Lacticaseibacillus jixiensis]|uniref:hypothetical protein n=1 Tax=Lacticaseibacillus jixiensis TaxID=3231926 RepID=UPI0036F357CB